jgi:hypothetical protein
MDQIIKNLLSNEDLNIINTLAFMSYNPSIGRVLQKGGVKIFKQSINIFIPKIVKIKSVKNYDQWHEEFISFLMKSIKTSDDEKLSYGQAQKAINVFMKVYIDWAKKPNATVYKNLKRYIHVPLDSILMKSIKKLYKEDKMFKEEIVDKEFQKTTALKHIDKETYLAWQSFFRKKYSRRPIVFDNIWAENRYKDD